MLKNADKYEDTSTHFTYNDYKKKVKKAPNKDMTIFISVFIIGVLIILGFAKLLSPNVDVGISTDGENEQISEEVNNSGIIDERLKKLKMEDDGEMFSPELDEKVVIPQRLARKREQESNEPVSVVDSALKSLVDQSNHQAAKNNEIQKEKIQAQTTPLSGIRGSDQQITNAKVVIGSYANEKQAEVAKTILQESGSGFNPIIKNIGGTYTLQVGSYSTRDKAQQVTNNLIKNNYPARVVVE